MNYLAHGYRYLDRPYFLAGTAIPDWLNVVDRRVRVRSKHAEPQLSSPHYAHQELAQGVIQHHRDDDRFHRSRAFAELSMGFAVLLRDRLPQDDGLRPTFLGHIIVEILLDACLAAQNPHALDSYYAALATVDADIVRDFIESATSKEVGSVAPFISRFLEVRFLYDYADNAKLLFRLNQVMLRVGLAEIPDDLICLLPELRSAVNRRMDELISPIRAQ